MEYSETIDYCLLLFIKLNRNIDSFIQDFEFVKSLKIIVINYVEDGRDVVTSEFHEKLIKKYILI